MSEAGPDELIESARAGDPEALDSLLRRYQPQIYRFGMKMCRNPDDAQDVLQETLFAAARALHAFRGASSLTTWLYTIARSFCIKQRRRAVSAPVLLSLDSDAPQARGAADTAPGPERVLTDREISAALDAAIGALEPEHREVLLLRDVEGLSAAEVAEVIGISVAAVKSRLHRARRAVRERLAPLLVPPETPAPRPTCPDVLSVLSRHLEGEIAAEACVEMERHVAGCSRCRTACDSLRKTLQLCGSMPAVAVPEALQEAIRRGIRGLLAERRA